MNRTGTILCVLLLVGCRATYPELSGVYVEDQRASVAHAEAATSPKPADIASYLAKQPRTYVITNRTCEELSPGMVVTCGVNIKKTGENWYQFSHLNWPDGEDSTVTIKLTQDGMLMSAPGYPERMYVYRRHTNHVLENIGTNAPNSQH